MPSSSPYREAVKQSAREAKWTLAVSVALFLFFWTAIALLGDSAEAWFGLPVWFWTAVIGGYLLSIAGVVFLCRSVFRDDAFDEAVSEMKKEEK